MKTSVNWNHLEIKAVMKSWLLSESEVCDL